MILVWNSSYEHAPGKRCRAWWGLEGMFAVGRGGGGGGGVGGGGGGDVYR